ncbi:MAG: GTP cyclohydrolase I [Spirochaetales bacterium]|nr:GTP cyclohydrolase I [Spirochaetales bacterium]
MDLKDWINAKITTDQRALDWFESEESEDRIVRAYQELLSGYRMHPAKILKTTRLLEGSETPATVSIEDIDFFSLCAHHFLPFYGKISITYMPGTRILGLGKFPRLVQAYARRFQIQEDLVVQIAEEIMNSGEARGARVSAQARHLCMCSRGPGAHNTTTTTSYTTGSLCVS